MTLTRRSLIGSSLAATAGKTAFSQMVEAFRLELLGGHDDLETEDGRNEADARRHLLDFTARMYPGYLVAPHIRQLTSALEDVAHGRCNRLIVVMPPRHSKSLNVSENFPAWLLGNYPDKRIIASSHTAALAYTFSRRVRNKIADPRYPFHGVAIAADKGAVQAWDIDGRRGGYLAVGVGGAPTGHGADVIIIDDPVRNAEAAESQIQRDNVDEWYRETMRTRLEPGGAIIVTATRWHEDDLTGRLLDAAEHGGEQWRVLHMPAIDDEGEALWPDRWPVAALESIKSAVGTRAFTAQYQGRPQPAEGGMFKRHWWRYWKPRNTHLPPVRVKLPGGGEDYIHAVEIPMDWDNSAQSWDMTFKDTSDGSYVVGLVGKRHGPSLFITDYLRERLSFTATLHALGEMTYRNPDVEAKLIEEKANGAAVISAVETALSGVIAVQVDGSKEARAHAATPHVEAGNVYLPHPLLPGMGWVEDFIAELSAFPTGKHDDQVDAFTQLDRYLLAGNGGWIREPSAAWESYWANQ